MSERSSVMSMRTQPSVLSGSHYPDIFDRADWYPRDWTPLAESHHRHGKVIAGLLRDSVIPRRTGDSAGWTAILWKNRKLTNRFLLDIPRGDPAPCSGTIPDCPHGELWDSPCWRCFWSASSVRGRIYSRWFYAKLRLGNWWHRIRKPWVPSPRGYGVGTLEELTR